MHLHHQAAIPAPLGHEAVGGVLQLEQSENRAFRLVGRKDGQGGVANELDHASACTADRGPCQLVVVVHDARHDRVVNSIDLGGVAVEAREGDKQGPGEKTTRPARPTHGPAQERLRNTDIS